MTTKDKEYYKMQGIIGKYEPRPSISRKQRAKVMLGRGLRAFGSGVKSGSVKLGRASGRGFRKLGKVAGKEIVSYAKNQRRPIRRRQFKEPSNEFSGFGSVGMGLGFNDPWGTFKPQKKRRKKKKDSGITIRINR